MQKFTKIIILVLIMGLLAFPAATFAGNNGRGGGNGGGGGGGNGGGGGGNGGRNDKLVETITINESPTRLCAISQIGLLPEGMADDPSTWIPTTDWVEKVYKSGARTLECSGFISPIFTISSTGVLQIIYLQPPAADFTINYAAGCVFDDYSTGTETITYHTDGTVDMFCSRP